MPEQWLEWLCIFRQNSFAFCLSHSHKADSALLLFLFRSSFYPFYSLCARIRSNTLHVTCNAFALASFAFAYSNIKLLICGYVLMLQLIMCVCLYVNVLLHSFFLLYCRLNLIKSVLTKANEVLYYKTWQSEKKFFCTPKRQERKSKEKMERVEKKHNI